MRSRWVLDTVTTSGARLVSFPMLSKLATFCGRLLLSSPGLVEPNRDSSTWDVLATVWYLDEALPFEATLAGLFTILRSVLHGDEVRSAWAGKHPQAASLPCLLLTSGILEAA